MISIGLQIPISVHWLTIYRITQTIEQNNEEILAIVDVSLPNPVFLRRRVQVSQASMKMSLLSPAVADID